MTKSNKSAKAAGKSSANDVVAFNFYYGSKMGAWKLEKGDRFQSSDFSATGIVKTILKKEENVTGAKDALLHLDMVYAPDCPLYGEAKEGNKRISAKGLLKWLQQGGELYMGRHKFYGYPQLISTAEKPQKLDFDANSDEDVVFE